MGAYKTPATLQIKQIQNTLRDRYRTRFSILKELFQNADDAEARTFEIRICRGRETARNPLLRGLGVLVVNDGKFTAEDREGIQTFSETSKSESVGSAGRFGLGQKSVFHLCDAFIVAPFGYRDLKGPFVLNPFLGLPQTRKRTKEWETTRGVEGEIERLVSRELFAAAHLAIWLPLRSHALLPDAEGSSFMPDTFEDPRALFEEMARGADLATILAAARHVELVRLVGPDEETLSLRRRGDRMAGPPSAGSQAKLPAPAFARTIEGAIDLAGPDGELPVRYLASEALVDDPALAKLRADPDWPRTYNIANKPIPEKAAPHGAAFVVRHTRGHGRLVVHWGVFFPTGEGPAETIPLGADGRAPLEVHLFLHGYFFVDSGRRALLGLGEDEGGAPAGSGHQRICAAWNRTLRDRITLPMLPGLLADACEKGVLAEDDLERLVRSLARHRFFDRHRPAICSREQLAKVVDGDAPTWRAVPAEAPLRSVPLTEASEVRRLFKALPAVPEFARERGYVLVATGSTGQGGVLSAASPDWDEDEIAALIQRLPADLPRNRAQADELVRFLDCVWREQPHMRIGRAICALMRRAMLDGGGFAGHTIRSLLRHVPPRLLLGLGESAADEKVLAALAGTGREPLAVRAEWLEAAADPAIADDETLVAMLRALEPIVSGPEAGSAERAARAAMTVIRRSGRALSTLADLPGLRGVALFPVTEVPAERQAILSLQKLSELGERGLLFQRAGQTRTVYKKVLDALPGLTLCLVPDAELIRALPNHQEGAENLTELRIVELVNGASRFGSAAKRSALVERLLATWRRDERSDSRYRDALRRLIAGVAEAGPDASNIYLGTSPALDPLLERLLYRQERAFLVEADIELSHRDAQALGVQRLDDGGLERILETALKQGSPVEITDEAQAEALLTSGISDGLLRRLPIHPLQGGGYTALDALTCLATDRGVPPELQAQLKRVRVVGDPKAAERQKRLVPEHDAGAEIRAALRTPKPHALAPVILTCLAELADGERLDPELVRDLGQTGWLAVADEPVRPADVLSLPNGLAGAVGHLARLGDGTWHLAQELPRGVREHSGWAVLERFVLPGRAASLERLARAIKAADIVGLPAEAGCDDTVRDLKSLGKAGLDLPLPGWPLAAAVLSVEAGDDDQEKAALRKCLAGLSTLARVDAEAAGATLDALADLAGQPGSLGEAAGRIYRRAFETIVPRDPGERRIIFSRTRVPTAAGSWKRAREVVPAGDGLADDCRLADTLGRLLQKRDRDRGAPGTPIADDPSGQHPTGERPPVGDLDAVAAERHRAFLEGFRNRVPPDLVLTYLALVGRSAEIAALMQEWAGGALVDPQTHVARLDAEVNKVLVGASLAHEVEERCVLVERVEGETVEAVSLAGSTFRARLDGGDGLLVGKRPLEKERRVRPGGRSVEVFRLPVRHGVEGDHGEVIARFAELIRQIADDCLWLFSSAQVEALDGLLKEGARTSQSLVDQTRATMLDYLERELKQLKPGKDGPIDRALGQYDREMTSLRHRHRRPIDGESDECVLRGQAAARRRLWDAVLGAPETHGELLSCVRQKIGDLGYDDGRVLLELFQNADDATFQSEERPAVPRLRLEVSDRALRLIHWGRPVNHRGRDAREGERRGWHHDLVNMLLFNVSEKQPGDGTTGKYGLGFKCVHGLTDQVGIASGLIALRTRGGLLPDDWPEGAAELERYRTESGLVPTLIDIPLRHEAADGAREAVEAFRRAAPFLTVFARSIREIEIEAEAETTVWRQDPAAVTDVGEGVRCVQIEGPRPLRALDLDLVGGFRMLLQLGETGPVPFDEAVPRLWNMEPFETRVGSGWLLEGPFKVSTSRSDLPYDRRELEDLMARLGGALGERLIALHEVAAADWPAFREALGLAGDADAEAFSSRVWSLFSRDLHDPTSRLLHAADRGLGALARAAPVVTTDLEAPFDRPVRATAVAGTFAHALTDAQLRERIHDWPGLAGFGAAFVSERTAQDLVALGHVRPPAVTMERVLQKEFAGIGRRVDPEVAARLGAVLDLGSIEKPPLAREYDDVHRAVAGILFRDAAGAWREARELSVPHAADDAEKLRATFAPPQNRLADDYRDEALDFFNLARARSGHGPQPRQLRRWAEEARTDEAREAFLRYLVREDKGALKDEVLASPPQWMQPFDRVVDGPLTVHWDRADRNKLRALLRNYEPEDKPPHVGPEGPEPRPETVLDAIWDWWHTDGARQTQQYEREIFPPGFDVSRLRDPDDRDAWFTLLALACFQGFGGTQDGQHRTFIEEGLARGWWSELARSRPPDDVGVWHERLNDWSGAELQGRTHWRWRRTVLDLYTIARWLPEYIRMIRELPQAVRHHGAISLADALTPSSSPLWQELGIEGAPLERPLGLGANWLVRELVRHGFWSGAERRAMAPYGWAATLRTRRLLARLGADVEDRAHMDRSRLIWAFVRNNLGERHLASLYADLDLPLQLVTLRRNEGVLASAGADWGADLGGLSGWPDDLVGEENDEVGEAAE